MENIKRRITQALSLRKPQEDSLRILADIVEQIGLEKDMDLQEALRLAQDVCSSVHDFERAFPCFCFAIATGVGKTRLMGAMIAYLHEAKGVKDFMVLAPNLTIYNKLKTDFQEGTPKYVFSGLKDYVNAPQIITGDDYDHVGDLYNNPNDDRIRINIFNISKIDSDKDARGTPRVRRMSEYLGQSYFDYLSGLKDLVLIMDEAHRYRANAGMAAINELHPVIGIELTATPITAGARPRPFQNIAYEYNLAHAITDGFVKKPAVVGRTNFDRDLYGNNDEELDNLKIKDAIKVHESLKEELKVYADNKKTKLVKPFIMIVAQNIQHAEDIKNRIDSDEFEEGHYKGKVIVVNSKQNGELKDETLQRLLAIEDPNEPTEIVVHVNMLGEGWDVNNLYTIVPLRAANARILVEQSIGRGLRLPFGELTNNPHIDRLHVIAHDRFTDIINAARANQFEFQQEYIDNSDDGLVGMTAINNTSKVDEEVNQGNVIVTKPIPKNAEDQPTLPVFSSETNNKIADTVREAIDSVSPYAMTFDDLRNADNQRKITQLAEERIKFINFDNSELSLEPAIDIEETVKRFTETFIKYTIDTPRIKIQYEQEGDFTFDDFDIDCSDFPGYEPVPQKVLIKELLDKSNQEEMDAEFVDRYENPTHYLLTNLIDYQEIDYSKNADLLNKLAKQVVDYINTYSGNSLNTKKILFFHNKDISRKIYEQMKQHLHEAPVKMRVRVDSGYATISSASYKISVKEGNDEVDYRTPIHDRSKIKTYAFVGFNKCIFSKQKFDSCTEKDLCEILENANEVLKWFKISNDRAKEIFDIKYHDSQTLSSHSYLPDFIVETTKAKYMIETKAENQMTDMTVKAKKKAAVQWCEYATNFEYEHGGKEWIYLLIPDTAVVIGSTFDALVAKYQVRY